MAILDEDLAAAALVVAEDEALEVLDWDVDDTAAAEVRDAYSEESVMVLTFSVVMVSRVFKLVTDWTRVWVSVIVVSPEGAEAVTISAVEDGLGLISEGAMDCGSVAVGFPMLAGRPVIPSAP